MMRGSLPSDDALFQSYPLNSQRDQTEKNGSGYSISCYRRCGIHTVLLEFRHAQVDKQSLGRYPGLRSGTQLRIRDCQNIQATANIHCLGRVELCSKTCPSDSLSRLFNHCSKFGSFFASACQHSKSSMDVSGCSAHQSLILPMLFSLRRQEYRPLILRPFPAQLIGAHSRPVQLVVLRICGLRRKGRQADLDVVVQHH